MPQLAGRPGMFTGAEGTDARNSIFLDSGGGRVKIKVSNHYDKATEDVLAKLEPVDHTWSSTGCMKGTRKYIFKEIDLWLNDMEDLNILWISGSPGAGKSAIASSMVSRLWDRRRLGSSFFFKRGISTLSDSTTVWRTVAYHLAKRDPSFACALVEDLKQQPPVHLNVESQFNFLIETPLTKTYASNEPHAIPVIIIDALDECDPDNLPNRKAFLKTLIQWHQLPKVFKIIVTGRDHRVPTSFRTVCKQIVLPTGRDVSAEASEDIRSFFGDHFKDLPSFFPEWSEEQTIDELTAFTAGVFMSAVTVMKLIEEGLPSDELKVVISQNLGKEDKLTRLYRQILEFLFQDKDEPLLDMYRLVVSTVVLTKSSFHRDQLPTFLSKDKQSVQDILGKLSPLILIENADKHLEVCHESFTDFLCDPKRCPKQFHIDMGRESRNLATICFEQMKKGLKFNICGLETSCLRNAEVMNLSSRIKGRISASLSYSCCFWGTHLRDAAKHQEGKIDRVLLEKVEDFFYQRLLFWLEVMSLINKVSAANAALLIVAPWILNSNKHLSAFARDASRFIVNFESPISESAPHIYLSALPFSPPESLVARKYQSRFPHALFVVSKRDRRWPAVINLSRGHMGEIHSVAFSPDGKWIVSGSDDSTIRIWDVETGLAIASPFTDHEGCVSSVAFSSDGDQVASGSWDKTVRIWDVKTGRITAGPFKGHDDDVNCVAFSPDGKCVVSGSDDCTISVWNIKTGQHQRSLKLHKGRVNSVTFSSDSKQIVSGSDDKTVYVWDAETGIDLAGPLVGHSQLVVFVAFLSDGKRVISGSSDGAIFMWNIESGQHPERIFQGRGDAVISVGLSQDGQRVASGSSDCAVHIWNVKTGEIDAGPFIGHTDLVRSVAFSPDGTQVVSGSDDGTIRIWDVEAGVVPAIPFELSEDSITCLAFSLDGRLVGSASDDNQIRLWNIETGQLPVSLPEGCTDSITIIEFSPDGKHIVSISKDKTIRVLDVSMSRIIAVGRCTDEVTSIAFSPDGKRIVSGLDNYTIRIWNVGSSSIRIPIIPFEGHTDLIRSVAFSPDGNFVVSGSDDKTILIWDAKTGQVVMGPFLGHTHCISSVAFSPDGRLIVSGSYDETIRVWDVNTSELSSSPFRGHKEYVTSVAFSPNGRQVVSGSEDMTVRVWDVETGRATAGPLRGHTDSVTAVAFLSDNKIISGSTDNTIRIWDLEIYDSPLPHPSSSSAGGVHLLSNFYYGPNASRAYLTNGWLSGSTSGGESDSKDERMEEPTQEINSDAELVLWVPPSYRKGLSSPETTFVFGTRMTKLDLSRFVYGKSWEQCYSPPSDVDSRGYSWRRLFPFSSES